MSASGMRNFVCECLRENLEVAPMFTWHQACFSAGQWGLALSPEQASYLLLEEGSDKDEEHGAVNKDLQPANGGQIEEDDHAENTALHAPKEAVENDLQTTHTRRAWRRRRGPTPGN